MSYKAEKWARSITVGNARAKQVLIELAYCMNDDTGLCYPSLQYLRTVTELKIDTITNATNHLERLGLIRKHREPCPKGIRIRYELTGYLSASDTQKQGNPEIGDTPENGGMGNPEIGETGIPENGDVTDKENRELDHINHNKEITEIRYGEDFDPKPLCLENSMRESIRDAQDNLCDEKKFEDDDSILTVLEVIKLCSYYRLKVARTPKLVDTVKSGRVSVGMVKECMDITKAQQKPGSYFVGCLANAIHEPDRYMTTIQKIRRSAQKEKEAEQFLLEHGDEVF